MSKKERMLEHISNNVGWFMNAANIKVIPYTDLSRSIFNTAKNNFAYQAEFNDVVCLISTSILDDGKCGVLFTTESVYTKAWAPFGASTAYKCDYWEGYFAEFSNVLNDFYVERMQEMLSDLFNISCDEGEKERKQEVLNQRLEKLGEVGAAIGVMMLAGMTIVDIIACLQDLGVDCDDMNEENFIDKLEELMELEE